MFAHLLFLLLLQQEHVIQLLLVLDPPLEDQVYDERFFVFAFGLVLLKKTVLVVF